MKITKIYVKNLFSYDEFEIDLDRNFNIIVGSNNAGKTNLFRTIQFLMDIIDHKLKANEVEDYLHDPSDVHAEIKIWVEFDKGEKQVIRDFFECYFNEYMTKLEKGIGENDFKLKDVLPGYTGPEGQYTKRDLDLYVNELFLRSIRQFISDLSKFLSRGVFVWQYSGEYSKMPDVGFYSVVQVDDTSLKPFIDKLRLDDDKSGHRELLKNLSSLKNTKISIGVASNSLEVSSLYSSKRTVGSLWDTLEREYLKFIKAVSVPNVFNLLFDMSSTIPSQLLLSFLLGSSFAVPEIIWKNVREARKGMVASLFSHAGLDLSKSNLLTLHGLLLRLFFNSIIKFSEVRGYPQPSSREFISTYEGNGIDLANYLYSLKNALDLNIREKYTLIKTQFERILGYSDNSIGTRMTFDTVVDSDGIPKIMIIEGGRQYNIHRVASGIFELLNLLAVIYGNQDKIILLDEPALHLHPVYQKRLAKLIHTISTENQVFMITHSPYLMNVENLKQVYRFYRLDGSTRVVRVGDFISTPREIKFLQNEQLVRALFSNGVLLVEGLSEYVSLPILLVKLGYPPEDYNIEIVNVGGKRGFPDYINLFEKLQIPYAIVCDGETAFNVYDWSKDNKKFNLQSSNFPILFEALKRNGILKPEHEEKLRQLVDGMPSNIDATSKHDVSEILEKCIKPLYTEFKDDLAMEYKVFTYPCWDWTDYLDGTCQETHKDSKTEKAWRIAQEIPIDETQERFSDLKKFIQEFIKKSL